MQANPLDQPEKAAISSDLLFPGPALLKVGDVADSGKFRQGDLEVACPPFLLPAFLLSLL